MREVVTTPDIRGQDPMAQLTAELVEMLRQRVDSRYYDQPQVLEVIARALLHSRGIYPQ
jgi:hypothetical protein